MSLGKTFNAISHFGASSLSVVEVQPDERHANRATLVLELYDKHRPVFKSVLKSYLKL